MVASILNMLSATVSMCLQDVCRSLEVDLTGQTSASYNMRLNYEKCLLEFESYLASGQFAAELAAGSAPAHHSLGHAFAKPAVILGAGGPSSSAGPSRLGQQALGLAQTAPSAAFQPFSTPVPGSPGQLLPPGWQKPAIRALYWVWNHDGS